MHLLQSTQGPQQLCVCDCRLLWEQVLALQIEIKELTTAKQMLEVCVYVCIFRD